VLERVLDGLPVPVCVSLALGLPVWLDEPVSELDLEAVPDADTVAVLEDVPVRLYVRDGVGVAVPVLLLVAAAVPLAVPVLLPVKAAVPVRDCDVEPVTEEVDGTEPVLLPVMLLVDAAVPELLLVGAAVPVRDCDMEPVTEEVDGAEPVLLPVMLLVDAAVPEIVCDSEMEHVAVGVGSTEGESLGVTGGVAVAEAILETVAVYVNNGAV
jgi:hypothetical protein